MNVSTEYVTYGSRFFCFEVVEKSLGLSPVCLLLAVFGRSRDVWLVFTHFWDFCADLNCLLLQHKGEVEEATELSRKRAKEASSGRVLWR